MASTRVSQVVSAPPERVFAAFTDAVEVRKAPDDPGTLESLARPCG